ncbi:MAG: PAS domain-containing protein [Planctomycetota bacterium]
MYTQQSDQIVFDRLLSHTHDGIFVLDHDRRLVLFNSACEQLTGYHADEVVGKESTCPDLLNCHDEHGRPLPEQMCPGLAVLNGRETSTGGRLCNRCYARYRRTKSQGGTVAKGHGKSSAGS